MGILLSPQEGSGDRQRLPRYFVQDVSLFMVMDGGQGASRDGLSLRRRQKPAQNPCHTLLPESSDSETWSGFIGIPQPPGTTPWPRVLCAGSIARMSLHGVH